MNTLKQRWQSGCLGKVMLVGAAVFLCLICALLGTVLREPEVEKTASDVAGTVTAPAVNEEATAVSTPVFTSTPRSTNTPRPPTATPVATNTMEPTSTPRSTDTPVPPTATTRPTDTPAPTSTPQPPPASETAFLPGLMPADIKVNLQNRGFSCSAPESGMSLYVWRCQSATDWAALEVIFYARTLTTVDFIDASAMQFDEPNDGLAAEFLGYVATMPFDNAEPEAARAWVVETLPTLQGTGDVREATFGGVPFTLFGIPTARVIEFGVMPGF